MTARHRGRYGKREGALVSRDVVEKWVFERARAATCPKSRRARRRPNDNGGSGIRSRRLIDANSDVPFCAMCFCA